MSSWAGEGQECSQLGEECHRDGKLLDGVSLFRAVAALLDLRREEERRGEERRGEERTSFSGCKCSTYLRASQWLSSTEPLETQRLMPGKRIYSDPQSPPCLFHPCSSLLSPSRCILPLPVPRPLQSRLHLFSPRSRTCRVLPSPGSCIDLTSEGASRKSLLPCWSPHEVHSMHAGIC